MKIKLSYRGDVKAIPEKYHEFGLLQEYIRQLHPDLRRFRITYLDEDGDVITVGSDVDFQALRKEGLPVKFELEDVLTESRGAPSRSVQSVSQEFQKLPFSIKPVLVDSFIYQQSVLPLSQPCRQEVISVRDLSLPCAEQVPLLSRSSSELRRQQFEDWFREKEGQLREQARKDLRDDLKVELRRMEPELSRRVADSLSVRSNQRGGVLHENIECDECGRAVQGVRYKCSVCINFDLCQVCESTSDHPHCFLKIKHPSQAPKAIFTILDEDGPSVFQGKHLLTQLVPELASLLAPRKEEAGVQTRIEVKQQATWEDCSLIKEEEVRQPEPSPAKAQRKVKDVTLMKQVGILESMGLNVGAIYNNEQYFINRTLEDLVEMLVA